MKAIHQLKDDRQLNFAEYSAKLLGNVLRENGVADQADIKGKNVLLFDDVYTTGATLNVCSRLLKEMGAKKVFCAAIATTLLDEKHKE